MQEEVQEGGTRPRYRDWRCSQGSPQMRYLAPLWQQGNRLPEVARAANLKKKLPKMGVFGDFLSILPNRPHF